MSNWTLPVVVPTINLRIEQRIELIVVAPQNLLTPDTKKFVADAACGGAWFNRTPWQLSRTGVNGITPGDVFNDVSVKNVLSPVLIGIGSTFPPRGFNSILKVANKRQYTSPRLDGNTPKLGAIVDQKMPDDLDSASIFRKEIGRKLSNGFSRDLYLRGRMNFENDPAKPMLNTS